MSILVSSNERKPIKQALGDFGIEANIPYDFKIFTERGIIAIERKRFPDDLLASVDDGRLSKEFAAMREEGDYQILISEGRGRYTREGRLLLGRRPSRWFKSGIRSLFRSIRYVEGIDVEFTDNIPDTVECLKGVQQYFDQDKHLSIRTRLSPEPKLFILTKEERYLHFLQGLPSIKIVRAMELAKVFRSPLELFGADMQTLRSVPGIGNVVAEGIYNFLRGFDKLKEV